MPIHFAHLLQESWNFMRNQRDFTLFGIALLVAVPLLFATLLPNTPIDPQALQSPEGLSAALSARLLPILLPAIINVFLNILLILNVKAISQGRYQGFFQQSGAAMVAFFPVVFLTILMVMPLSLAMSFVQLQGQASLLLLPLLGTGLFVFVKLCLGIYVYLVEQKGVSETLKITWAISRGRLLPLVLFCVLSYLFPLLIGSVLSQITGIAGVLISQLVSGVLNLFIVILSFRFYQIYRQQS